MNTLGIGTGREVLASRFGGSEDEIGLSQAGILVPSNLLAQRILDRRGVSHGRTCRVEDHGATERFTHLEHRDTAPRVANQDDVVVGTLELPAQRSAKGLGAREGVLIRNRDAEDARGATALDVGLIGSANTEDIDQVVTSERAQNVSELDTCAIRPWEGTEAGDQNPGHLLREVGIDT